MGDVVAAQKGTKFLAFPLDELIDIFVANIQLGEGVRARKHRYWYDQDKGEIAIRIETVREVDEEEDDDPGNGGLPVRHRGPEGAMTQVVVAGSRGMWLRDSYLALASYPGEIDAVVCGEAAGTDTHGRWWAEGTGRPVLSYPADWKANGKAAGPIRNRKMGEVADEALIVWDGASHGAANMASVMHGMGKPYLLVGPVPSERDIEYDL